MFFFGCMNVLGCLAVVLNLQSARKLVQILCWLERGNEACPSITPSMQCRAAVWPTCKKYLKNSTFGGGVGVVGVNCSVLWSYPFKDNVYKLPTVGCFPHPLPPTLKRSRSPHSSSVIKSKMAATTMQVLFGIVCPKNLALPATHHFVSMFCSPDRLCINLYSYSPTGDFSHWSHT